MAKDCMRCGGQVLRNYEDEGCLQCGHDPHQCEVEREPERPSRDNHRFPVNETRVLSSKPSQVRRRRRRLLASGYSDDEVREIIKAQIGGMNV